MNDSVTLLPAFDPTRVYNPDFAGLQNFDRYKGTSINDAIYCDNADQLKEAIDLGWLTKDSRCFNGSSVIRRCLYKGAVKCAELLRSLGYPE